MYPCCRAASNGRAIGCETADLLHDTSALQLSRTSAS